MLDKEHQIATLNELLKGEYMAAQVYEKTKGIQGDEQVRKMLEQFAQDHRKHAERLAARIRELGGEPVEGAGFAGMLSNMMGMFNALQGPDKLLQQVYEGEDMGVHAYEDRIDELDPKSQELVQNIMDEDQAHLEQFTKRIKSEEAER